jgi:hypothetical protein
VTAAAGPTGHARAVPVLGYKKLIGSFNGEGWGTVKPKRIGSGSADGTADLTSLSWSHWGRSKAIGRGKVNVLLLKRGGHQLRPIELRATHISTCHGKRAYNTLYFREASKPHATVGKHWKPWFGKHGNIC